MKKAEASSHSSGVAFTGTVRAIQTRKGSGSGYAMEERGVIGDALAPICPTSSRSLRRNDGYTAFTNGVTGKTRTWDPQLPPGEVEPNGDRDFAIPLQPGLVIPRDPSEIAGPWDRLSLWAGQSANLSACTEVSAVVTSSVDEFSKIAGRLWSGAHMAIGNMRILSPTTAEVP